MDMEKLKCVVGKAEHGKCAYIRFYGCVNEENVRCFNDEFLWLQNVVKPSKIVIGINSEGGSVVAGMGTFSIIQNSPIETETIIEGLAASMGSVLWSAGTRSYMRDYSILMIHNPFLSSVGNDSNMDENTRQMVEAFKKQIETVYVQRFGLSKEKVRDIMDGKSGVDGTWFDAKEAVEAGIISPENIIKTQKQVKTKVKNKIGCMVDASKIQEMMASINAELGDFKPLVITNAIPNQNTDLKNSNSPEKMEKEQDTMFGSVCAQLGLETTAGIADVMNTINALKETSKQLDGVKNEYNALKIQKEGLDAKLTNVTNELNEVKAELKTYKDAEKEQHDAEITAFVEAAITDGKIKEESKSMWVEMAQTNFEMVKNTLDSIDKQEKISEKIASDPANVQDAANGMTEAERRMQESVSKIVGANFKFGKLD